MGLFGGKKKKALEKYLSQRIEEKEHASIIPEVTHELGGKQEKVTVFLSKIYGFEEAARLRELNECIDLLNEYYKMIIDTTLKLEGTFLGIFAGMVFSIFGAPMRHHNDARRAVRCAFEIQKRVKEFNEERSMRGREIMQIGMALNTGDTLVGHFGTPRRMSYTAMGDTVNLCYTFCELAEPGQILGTQSLCNEIKDTAEIILLRPLKLPNAPKPIPVFKIKALKQYHSELSVKYTGIV